jgi:hypothetical protein
VGLRAVLSASAAGAAALVTLAACGGGAQLAPPVSHGLVTQQRAFGSGPVASIVSLSTPYDMLHGAPVAGDRSGLRIVDPDVIKPQIDVGQYGTTSGPGEVNEYAAGTPRKPPFCQLANLLGVNAIETDASGNLWVPQVAGGTTSETIEYAPDCGKAGTTLSDPYGQPGDIAFAANGTRYVSDILGNGSVAGDIGVIPKGKTAPTSKLVNANVFFSLGVALDSKGNLYESFIDAAGTGGGVIEFVGGKGAGKVLGGIKITEPGTLIIDKHDNLITTDQNANTLDTYAPPYTKAPATFPLKGQSIQCALNAAGTNVACADRGNNTVDVYKYPTGMYTLSFNAKLSPTATTIGIAQDPRE